MSIAPWLAKHFRQGISWSNARDYPPKRKKPWRYTGMQEMEGTHVDHMELPWADPMGDAPLPPSPDIPQTAEDPDPCVGDRDLWVLVSPDSKVDCDGSLNFSLIISPDFRCIEIQQLFIGDGPLIVDSLGNNFEHPTNAEDITGELVFQKGCENPSSVQISVCDCLCGGCTVVSIWPENCGTDCEAVFVNGLTQISSYSVTQYTLANFSAGEIVWSVSGEGATIDQNGLLTADGACGTINVIATTDCCGAVSQPVQITDDGLWVQASIEYKGPECPEGIDYGAAECETVIEGVPGESAFTKIVYECRMADLPYELPGDCLYCPCPPYGQYPDVWSNSITIYNWECAP